MTTLYSKIFLGDDDSDDTELFQEAFGRVSPLIELHIAENGLRLLELLEEQEKDKPDLIFLDINMPVMNGWECLRKLKENSAYKNIPVIVYSTSAAQRDIKMAYDWGAHLYLPKTDDFRNLEKIIRTIMETPIDMLFSRLNGYDPGINK